jgi:hypothetical protein
LIDAFVRVPGNALLAFADSVMELESTSSQQFPAKSYSARYYDKKIDMLFFSPRKTLSMIRCLKMDD